MKLLRVGEPAHEQPAVLIDGVIRDVSKYFNDYDEAFFANNGLERLTRIVDSYGDLPEVANTARIGPPIARPHQVLCIGLNYADHAKESGSPTPTEPIVFSKAPNTLVGPNDDVMLPPDAVKVDWEVELGVVISRRARYLTTADQAWGHIAGWMLCNDVSEREYQLERGGQWIKGKSAETFNPAGPWLVTTDESIDIDNLPLTLAVNGEIRQEGTTANMIFGVKHIVWYLSQFMVLEPGDLINTGTPAGVGLGLDPPLYLKEGDVMELSGADLGTQHQVCRRASR